MESNQQFEGSAEAKDGEMTDINSDPPAFVPKTNKGSGTFPGPDGKMVEIRDVWRGNLEEEMCNIRKIVDDYPFVSMDTEFPGVVARPITDQYAHDYQYQTVRCNVDLLKIIQLGIGFVNEKGEHPEGCVAWQFNFKFSLTEDMYAQDSIDLLKDAGIDFAMHESDGIDVTFFGELMITSGLVLMDNVRWVSFHSGYDFGYLLKLLTCTALPSSESDFFELLKLYFPYIYDIKFMIHGVDGLHGGLQKIGEDVGAQRIGPMHQAGSDALLTVDTFFKICERFDYQITEPENDHKYVNELFGLGGNSTVYRPPPRSDAVDDIPDDTPDLGTSTSGYQA